MQEEEWRKAQEISISVDLDLISAAKQHLLFLASVDRYRCLYHGPALQRAIYRYEQCWLPLLAEHTESGNANFRLVVPLDCEWIWHCHRLNPVQYGKDCKKVYGRILDASFVESFITEADRKQTEDIWKYSYPEEPYELDLSHSVPGNSAGTIFKSMYNIEYDLTDAVRRQSSFFHQVSPPYISDERFLKGAEERYKGFLYLIKKNRDNSVNCFCVPTYDVDLMWHSHQLQPVAYRRDMLNLLGKVLEHDDMDSDRSQGKKLDVGFTETTRQWETTYGRRYWRAGAMHKGDAPSPVPSPPLSSENSNCVGEPLFQSNQDNYLTPVKIVEVLLEVVGIRNIPEDHKGTLFVRYHKDNCPEMEAKEVEITSESQCKQIASFMCEATGDFIFELRSRSSRTVKRTSNGLGRVSIPLQTLLDSTTLSVENWFPLSRNGQRGDSKPISLHIAVSVTPPATAPHLLWCVRSHCFERKLQFLECIRRIKRAETVMRFLDHHDKEIFTVKTRTTTKPYTSSLLESEEVCLQGLPDKRRILTVYRRNPSSKKLISSVEIVANAEELITVGGTARWALMNNSCNLLLKNLNNVIKEEPIFELTGNLGKPLRLLSGRKLQYEVKYAKPEIEHEFVTLVRYTREAPFGQATSLFNWKSGIIEVAQQESVLLVVLISTIISASLTKQQEGLKCTSTPEAEGKTKVFATGNGEGLVMHVKGTDEKLKAGGNRRRGGCGSGCGGGCGSGCGGGAAANSNTHATNVELGILVAAAVATNASSGCGGCGSGCGGCGGNATSGPSTGSGASGGCGGGCGGGGGCGSGVL